ncbi:MAG: CPBP family intramembrane metalloprotease [Deltaproteobacteria bacterium]|nr:CPBP family intramembrane metalloprotease [Deltaproteobacteria bacterium]
MEPEFPSRKIQWQFVAIFYGFFILAAYAWVSFQKGRTSPLFFSATSRVDLIRDSLLGVGTAVVVVLLSQAIRTKWEWSKRLEEEFEKLLCPIDLPTIAWVSLWSGFGEEILFRGAMQPVLGLVLTSFIFGLFHFPVRRLLLPWTLMSILIAFILGGLFAFTGNLLAPVLCHFTINFANLSFLKARYDKKRGELNFSSSESDDKGSDDMTMPK